MIEKDWIIASQISKEANENLSKYPPLLRQVLFNRGISSEESATNFLAALPLENDDPFLMSGMKEAVDRLERAIKDEEAIVIYGDYDADGVTSTTLMVKCLSRLGAKVSAYIPDRFDEGYGLNNKAINKLAEAGANVIVSVDCGIRAINEAKRAKRLGIDLIITDHHSVGPELPDALAIINCKLPDDQSENKYLSGAGTAYKLAKALVVHMSADEWNHAELLDLAAIGTVADLVPLLGENRWMVRKGLAAMRQTRRQGVLSLIGVSGLRPAKLTSGDIAFMLGPRINAAGRLGSALEAFNLLMTDDVSEAGKLAQVLDNRNRERRKMTLEMAEAAAELIDEKDIQANLLIAIHEDFHAGIAGLVASQLSDKYYRPAIVGEQGPERTQASCRSIPEFHITDALQECAHLFENFGGHAAAAGFTIKNEHIRELEERLGLIAKRELGGMDLRPSINADTEIGLGDLKAEMLDYLELVEPTGYGNRQVHFVSRNLEVRSMRSVGKDKSHLKLAVSDGWITYDAIAFRQGHWLEKKPKRIDLLYRFESNEFHGQKRLQLNVQDIKESNSIIA